MILRSQHRFQWLESYRQLPTRLRTALFTGCTALPRLGRFPSPTECDADGADGCLSERKHDIARHHPGQIGVGLVAGAVRVRFGRPEIFAFNLVALSVLVV